MNVGGKYDRVKEALLFTKCLGLNDTVAQRTQKTDPETGETELIDCLNVTTTPDGAIEKIPALVTAFTHTAPVTGLSAGSRFIYQDAINTREWNGTAHATIGAVLTGPVVHTPISVRLSSSTAVYKSLPGAALLAAPLGSLAALPDRDKRPYYAQPAFTKAFMYNGHLYGVNAADTRFLQYSEYANHDVWALGDSHISHEKAVLDGGAIVSEKPGQTGCIMLTHASGISVYDGANANDFSQKSFSVNALPGTLYSGFISKAYGYAHIFLGEDGIYAVDPDGVITNLTVSTFQHVKGLNTVYHAATVVGGKYIAYGDNVAIEYDFRTKSVLKRTGQGIVAATNWLGTGYVSSGATVSTFGASDQTEGDPASITLPYQNLGVNGTKGIQDLYFTGNFTGAVTVTASAGDEVQWVKEFEGPGEVFNYRVKTPNKRLGNHISFKIETSGAFRLETLKATFVPSYRSR